MSAEAYLAHLTGEATHDELGRAHYPRCPGCDATRWHRADCDAAERWGVEARRLFYERLVPSE